MTTHHDYPRRTFHDVEQRSDEWHNLRRGILTASTLGRLITRTPVPLTDYPCYDCGAEPYNPCLSKARTKTEPTPIKTTHRSRENAAAEVGASTLTVADNDVARTITTVLAAERITGHTEDTPITPAMWRGIEDEPFARDAYAEHHAPVTEIGFITLDLDPDTRIGYSPDGLVGETGLIEIKSRAPKKQIETILADDVPPENVAQLQVGLFVTGRKWIDYVSFAGGMPLYVKRVTPDPEWFAVIEQAVRTFEANVADLITRYHHAAHGLPMTERVPDPYEIQVA